MSFVDVDIFVEDFDVQRIFDNMLLALSGPSLHAFLREGVSDFFRTNIEERFNEEGDVHSGFWPPLSEATIHIKSELPTLRDSPETINVRTGALYDFVTGNYQIISGSNWAQVDIPGESSDPLTTKKLETAQKGSATNPVERFGPTPPRPVLATSEMQLAMILEMLEYHILDVMVGSVVA